MFSHVVLVAACVTLAGRSILQVTLETGKVIQPLPGINYIALGVGAALTTLLTGVFRSAGTDGPAFVLLALCFIALATLALVLRRGTIALVGLQPHDEILGYIISCIILWLMFFPSNYFDMAASSVYLTQGFDLYFDKDPSVWPYFGELYHMPFTYVTHPIGSVFALFSNGNRHEYYEYGQFWVSIILAPLVPLGAYLFFQLFMRRWAAAILACVFVLTTIKWKMISIRGETLGWIVGFGFLLGLASLMDRFRRGKEWSRQYVLVAIVATLYFTVSLTHGVVAMMVSFMAAGLVISDLSINRDFTLLRQLPQVIAVSGTVLVVLGTIYWAGFLSSYPPEIRTDPPAMGGEPDAALLLRAQFDLPKKTKIRLVAPAGPLADRFDLAVVAVLLPPAQLLHPHIASYAFDQFPDDAIKQIKNLNGLEKLSYPLLFAVAIIGWTFPFPGNTYRLQCLFWGFIAGYVGLSLFAVVLNEMSRSTFPLAIIQRTYGYGTFCYWGCVLLSIYRVLSLAAEGIPDSAKVFIDRACVLFFMPCLTALVVSRVLPDRSPSVITHQIAAKFHFASSPFISTTSAKEDLYSIMDFIRSHTKRGEWVYSNIISDNQFWFLTDGRYSLTEGSAMYQIYPLQRRAEARLESFRKFAQNSDSTAIDAYHVRYVLLYRETSCRTDACAGYGFAVIPASLNEFLKSNAYSMAFENASFLVFERKHQ